MTPPRQRPLFGEEVPVKLSGRRLAAELVEMAKANGGYVQSTYARKKLVNDGVLRGGEAGVRLLYQALTKYKRFLRVKHGLYRLNLAYTPTPKEPRYEWEVTAEQMAELEELRAYDSKVLH